MKIKILLAAIFLCGVTAGYDQWRHITAEEDTFVRTVEAKVNKFCCLRPIKCRGSGTSKLKRINFSGMS
jgi:hypothetical protein